MMQRTGIFLLALISILTVISTSACAEVTQADSIDTIIGYIQRAERYYDDRYYLQVDSQYGTLWVQLPEDCPPANTFDSLAIELKTSTNHPAIAKASDIDDAITASSVRVLASMGGIIREIQDDHFELEVIDIDNVYNHPHVYQLETFIDDGSTPSDASYYFMNANITIIHDPDNTTNAGLTPLFIMVGHG